MGIKSLIITTDLHSIVLLVRMSNSGANPSYILLCGAVLLHSAALLLLVKLP